MRCRSSSDRRTVSPGLLIHWNFIVNVESRRLRNSFPNIILAATKIKVPSGYEPVSGNETVLGLK